MHQEMAKAILLCLSMLLLTVDGSETKTETLFVQKGQDVLLDVGEYVILTAFELLVWEFNKSKPVVTFNSLMMETSKGYQDRVERWENFSIILKNLQEADSGLYEAKVAGNHPKTFAVYSISVQEAVQPPVLTVDSNSISSDSCNVTVTCRGQDTSVTSSCNNRTCSQVGGESGGVTTSTVPLLSVYLSEGSIICNQSNQVSWRNDTKEIKGICYIEPVKQSSPIFAVILVTVGSVIVITVIAVIAVTAVYRLWRRRNAKKVIINMIYATVQPPNGCPGGGRDASPGPQPNSVYCMVHAHDTPNY